MMDLSQMLLEKSVEAFTLAIEIYNKPTIRYRVEGFCFFICNAWELMLKAHIIKNGKEEDIYYKDNPSRTLSLEGCIQKVDTNRNSPIRKNIEKITSLRNTSTHFITDEYELIYVPLFQACVSNFEEKMQQWHNIDITQKIPHNFLNLTVTRQHFSVEEINAKYPKIISSKILDISKIILQSMEDESSPHFAINIIQHAYITKKPSEAALSVHIDSKAEDGVKILKELQDPSQTHQYSCSKCVEEIKKHLRRNGIILAFNRHHFNLFMKKYEIKNNEKMCYVYKVHANPVYSYSVFAIEFIVNAIIDDPGILEKLKKDNKKS